MVLYDDYEVQYRWVAESGNYTDWILFGAAMNRKQADEMFDLCYGFRRGETGLQIRIVRITKRTVR